MERNKKTPPLFLLLALLHVCTARMKNCPRLPQKNLTCYNDFNHTILCVWNSTYVSDHANTVCTIHAEKDTGSYRYSSSCNLEPVDVSRPTLKKCSLVFKRKWTFLTSDVLSINLICNPGNQSLKIAYKPACHMRPNPPPKPDINSTTVSWVPQATKHQRITCYSSQLQWKREDQSWSDPSVLGNQTGRDCSYTVELNTDLLIKGERYEARVRVLANLDPFETTWSDWSPIASWVSTVGRTKSTLDVAVVAFGIIACVAMCALFLAFIRTDKANWIYLVKRIRGPPLPNPAKSFLQDVNFQNWLSPHLTSESFHSFLNPVEIVSIETTSTVDSVAPFGRQAALLEKMRSERNHESTSSNFSNPSYSQLFPSPPVSSLTAGNLKPCTSDTPYGPVGGQGEGKNAEQDRDELRGKEVEILQLLGKGNNNNKPMAVISDYEKVERPQVERFRLPSLDSGVCSGEEVSQESLEADSISVPESHEGPEGREEREGGNGKEGDFQKLFGGSGGTVGKGSIQVCSDYEQVQKLQAETSELPSLDSGISSGGEEQVTQEESLDDLDKSTESTSLLFPPPSPPSPPSSAVPCSLLSFTPLPLNFSGPGLSPALQPLPSHILERIALMSTNRLAEASGDGYMPVRQEQS